MTGKWSELPSVRCDLIVELGCSSALVNLLPFSMEMNRNCFNNLCFQMACCVLSCTDSGSRKTRGEKERKMSGVKSCYFTLTKTGCTQKWLLKMGTFAPSLLTGL